MKASWMIVTITMRVLSFEDIFGLLKFCRKLCPFDSIFLQLTELGMVTRNSAAETGLFSCLHGHFQADRGTGHGMPEFRCSDGTSQGLAAVHGAAQ